MALLKLALRPSLGLQRSEWVCKACSTRTFSSTPSASADEQQPGASSPTANRPSPRRAREQSAAALAAIQKLQQSRPREPQSYEPSSLRGTARMGSAYGPSRPAPNVGGLRYQPRNVPSPPHAQQQEQQQQQQLQPQPQLRIRRPTFGHVVPPQGGGARRDSPEALDEGARQNRPASRQRDTLGGRGGSGGSGRRRGDRTRGQRRLSRSEEEDLEAEAAAEEAEWLAAQQEALHITEEDLATAALVKQKRTGAAAANHHGGGAGIPGKDGYMRRRAAAIAAQMARYRKDEESLQTQARRRQHTIEFRFGGRGPLKVEANRHSHTLRGRSWAHMLALQRSPTGTMERLPDSDQAKWDMLVNGWLYGKYGGEQAPATGGGSKPSRASAALRAMVNHRLEANPSYDGKKVAQLMEKLSDIGAAARL